MEFMVNLIRLLKIETALLLAALLATGAVAQVNDRIFIDAQSTRFDNERGALHLQENVRITRGNMEINADEGWAFRSDNSLQQVELAGSPVTWRAVTEDGSTTSGRADQVVYDPRERTITLIGNAFVEEPRGSFSGHRLTYNIDTQATEGQGGIHMEVEADVSEKPADSNNNNDDRNDSRQD